MPKMELCPHCEESVRDNVWKIGEGLFRCKNCYTLIRWDGNQWVEA